MLVFMQFVFFLCGAHTHPWLDINIIINTIDIGICVMNNIMFYVPHKAASSNKFSEKAANTLTGLCLLKLPCAPSCMMLKPIAETIPPSKTHSSNAHTIPGVKNTRWIYRKDKSCHQDDRLDKKI